MWTALLGFLPNLITEYIGKKQDLKKLERTAEIDIKKATVDATIRRLESSDKADTELDKASIGQIPWGDDWLLIMISAPMVTLMASPFVDLYYLSESADFVYQQGMLATAVGTGFEELSKAPDYYFYGVGGVFIYVLGMRRMLNNLIEKAVIKLPFVK